MSDAHHDEIRKLEALYAEHPEGRIFTHLAEAYRKAGHLEQARAVLDDGIARHPDYSSAQVVLGRVLIDQGRPGQAEAAFQRVLELDAHNMVALRSLGDLAREEGRTSQALDYYERLLDVEPADPEVRERVEELRQEAAASTASAESEELVEGSVFEDAAWSLSDPPPEPAGTGEPGATPAYDWSDPLEPTELEQPEDAAEPSSQKGDPSEEEEVPEGGPYQGAPFDGGPYGGAAFDADHSYEDGPADEEAAEAAEAPWTGEWSGVEPDAPAEAERFEPGGAYEPVEGEPGEPVEPIGGLERSEAFEGGEEPEPLEGFEPTEPSGFAPLEGESDAGEAEDFGVEPERDEPSDPSEEPWTPYGESEEEARPGAGEVSEADAPTEEPLESEEAFPSWEAEPTAEEQEGWPGFVDGEVSAGDAPEPDEEDAPSTASPGVMTETIAQVYARQGLYDRAAEVYRELVRERPDDAALRERLAEVEEAARETAAPSQGPTWQSEPAAAAAAAPEPEEGSVWTGEDWSDAEGESPYAWADLEVEPEPDESGPIQEYFHRLLDWRGEAAGGASEQPEAAEEAPGQPEAAEPGAEPGAEPVDNAPAVGPEDEDDDDLEMFRSWLESLRQ